MGEFKAHKSSLQAKQNQTKIPTLVKTSYSCWYFKLHKKVNLLLNDIFSKKHCPSIWKIILTSIHTESTWDVRCAFLSCSCSMSNVTTQCLNKTKEQFSSDRHKRKDFIDFTVLIVTFNNQSKPIKRTISSTTLSLFLRSNPPLCWDKKWKQCTRRAPQTVQRKLRILNFLFLLLDL